MPIDVPSDSAGFPLRPGCQTCLYYTTTGVCAYGRTCRYHHPELEGTDQRIAAPPVTKMVHHEKLGVLRWDDDSGQALLWSMQGQKWEPLQEEMERDKAWFLSLPEATASQIDAALRCSPDGVQVTQSTTAIDERRVLQRGVQISPELTMKNVESKTEFTRICSRCAMEVSIGTYDPQDQKSGIANNAPQKC